MTLCVRIDKAACTQRQQQYKHSRSVLCRSKVSSRPLRRDALFGLAVALSGVALEAQAGAFTKSRPKKVPLEEYSTLENGLKYYDLEVGGGFGGTVSKGDTVTVHFDVYLGKIDVVSSRFSALLGKNEIIPEPFTFTAGKPVNERKAKKADGGQAGGSFSGLGGPKPPPALSTSVLGMAKGGKRSVIVPAEQAYGDKGFEEIPPGATVELQIEVLDF